MTTISEPFVTVNITNASSEVGNTAQKVLFVGQKSALGTAVAGQLVENILNDSSWDTLFGSSSMLAAMVRAARKLNPIVQFDAIPLEDDGSAVAAAGSLNFTGTATTDGVVTVSIGSDRNHTFEVAVASGDDATSVATNVKAALDGDANLPVASVVSTSNVSLTAINLGTYGNTIGLSSSSTAEGITATVTAMTGGATDPDVTGVFDVVGNLRYQGVAWGYGDDVSELTDFLDPRFNADNNVLDGCGFVSVTDTLVNHLSRLNALNSENLVEICDASVSEGSYAGPAQLEIPAVKASMFAAIRALRLTEDASVSEFVISANGALDAFGGPALASKPYFNTPFPQLPLVGVGRGFTEVEIQQINDAGGAVIGNNTARNTAIIGEVPTTYKTDNAGNTDVTFKYLNYRDTASASREYFFNNLKARFAQSRLTEGATVRGRDQVNDLTIVSFIEKLYQDLGGPEFVLVQAGDQAIAFFKENLDVVLDLAQGKATVQMITPIVTQLRTILVTQKISFSAEQ